MAAKKTKVSLDEKNHGELQNAAKTLFANIRFSSIDNEIRTICITSSVSNEGKTTTSMALAEAIATSGKTVLLVEADMRRRALASRLRLAPKGGSYAVITGKMSLNDAVCYTPVQNLFFLDTEPNIPNPADIISSKRYALFVERMKESFDYVLFDTPPLETFVDSAILSTLVDGTLFILRTGSTKREKALSACKQLQQANAHVLGTVLTFYDDQKSDYYYSYYTEEEDISKGRFWNKKK